MVGMSAPTPMEGAGMETLAVGQIPMTPGALWGLPSRGMGALLINILANNLMFGATARRPRHTVCVCLLEKKALRKLR